MQGRLRVSLPVLFGQRCVAPLLFRLSQRYPLLKLELHYSDRQVNLLEEGFDLAVRIGSLADTGSLRARALESTAWCCARRRSTCASSQRRRLLPG